MEVLCIHRLRQRDKKKSNVIKREKWIIYLNVFHRVCN